MVWVTNHDEEGNVPRDQHRSRRLFRLELIAAVAALITAMLGTSAGAAQAPAEGPPLAPVPDTREPSVSMRAFHNGVADALQKDGPASFGADYGGAWVAEDGRVMIRVRGVAAKSRFAASPMSAVLADPKVQMVPAGYSLQQLDNAMGQVTASLNSSLPAATSVFPWKAHVDVATNVIRVVVDTHVPDGAADAAIHELSQVLPTDMMSIERGAVDQTTKSCSSRTSCTPVRGGIKLWNSDATAFCSTGFTFRGPDGARYVSTASHCAGSPWQHPLGTTVGPTSWTMDSGNVDGKLIRMSNYWQPQPNNSVYRDANHDTRVTLKISNPSWDLMGNWICSEGVSGEKCGGLITHDGSWQGRAGFGMIDVPACPGDSGAAILNMSTNRAYGLLTGGPSGCNGPNYFSWTAYLEAASGYSVLLQKASETLLPNQALIGNEIDQLLMSTDGHYSAVMQSDGNFVLYGCCGAIWSTATNGYSGSVVRMQTDGNLVVYSPGDIPRWWSGTNGRPGTYLVMQTDGNLVAYQPGVGAVWASGTNGRP